MAVQFPGLQRQRSIEKNGPGKAAGNAERRRANDEWTRLRRASRAATGRDAVVQRFATFLLFRTATGDCKRGYSGDLQQLPPCNASCIQSQHACFRLANSGATGRGTWRDIFKNLRLVSIGLHHRPKCTINSATSAGVMPLMRLAWARLTGRMRASFSRASARRCGRRA